MHSKWGWLMVKWSKTVSCHSDGYSFWINRKVRNLDKCALKIFVLKDDAKKLSGKCGILYHDSVTFKHTFPLLSLTQRCELVTNYTDLIHGDVKCQNVGQIAPLKYKSNAKTAQEKTSIFRHGIVTFAHALSHQECSKNQAPCRHVITTRLIGLSL